MTGDMPASRLAAAYSVACALLFAGVGVVAGLHLASGQGGMFDSWAVTLVIGASASVLGALLLWRRPAERLGWLIAALGAALLLQTWVDCYAAYSVHVHELPAAAWAFAANEVPSGLLVGLATLLLLLFPTGASPSPRWRWLAMAVAASAVAGLPGRLTHPGTFVDLPQLVNPIGVHAPALQTITSASNTAGIPLLLLAAVSVLSRWRRAELLMRDQIKWLLTASALWPVVIVVLVVTPTSFSDSRWGEVLFALPIVATLLAVVLAVLRYRLYEIDRVISRTLTYAVVSALLAGAYIGCVTLLTHALPFSSSVGVAASTLVVAAAFNPIRRRVQVAVDRRFNRTRYDAGQLVSGYSAHLRDSVHLEGVTAELFGAVNRAVQPATLSLWLAAE